MSDAQYCPRAVSEGRGGPNSPFNPPFNGEMVWRTDQTCSWCGSLSGDALMARLEAGDVSLTPTDKMGVPGHFYVTPYFCVTVRAPAPDDGA